MARRKTRCSRCGVARTIIVKGAKVMDQSVTEGVYEVGLKPLCLQCFLRGVQIDLAWIQKEHKDVYDLLMSDVE